MKEEAIQTACPRDCQDCCSLIAYRQEGKLTKVEGDPEHPLTQGFICPRGHAYTDLVYHPRRLLNPMQKKDGVWEEIGWEEAFDFLLSRIMEVIM